MSDTTEAEPQALPGWSGAKQRAVLAGKYVALLEQLQAADPRPLEADIAFWFGTVASYGSNGCVGGSSARVSMTRSLL